MMALPASVGLFKPGAVDPHWASVVALLHMNGVDGSTAFLDDTGRAWTAHGNAQIDTAESRFGGASGLFDGTGDYIRSLHDTALSATTDFTLEVQARWEEAAGRINMLATKRTETASSKEYMFYIGIDAKLTLTVFNPSSVAYVAIVGTTSLPQNTWMHLAFTRQGSTWRIFKDGVLEGSAAPAGTYGTNTIPLYLGRDPSTVAGGLRDFKGHLDEVRITKGVARYTANFTPPTGQFPNG